MACGQHGRLFFCYRRAGHTSVSTWLYRLTPHHLLYQRPRHHSRLLFLDLRSTIWLAPNGAVPLLLWLSWGEDQYVFPLRPGLNSVSKLPVRESGADWTLQSPSSMS